MTVHVYVRCNSGHYFEGSVCPFDGWVFEYGDEVETAAARIRDTGADPTVRRLRDHGVDADALARVAVIDFGTDASSFEALDPAAFVVDGEYFEARSAPRDLK